jgi:ribosomal-protein-alanine N-acetyltransferase
MNKPLLQTTRLTLLPFEPADLKLLHQTFTDPFVRRYLLDDEIITIERSSEFMSINQTTFREKGWGLWKVLIKAEGNMRGLPVCGPFFDEDQPKLLYGLLKDHQQRVRC